MKRMKISLAWQIVIALILGILVGAFLHNAPEIRDDIVANFLQPLGKIFINLIKMIVIPLVLSMLILGIANAGDSKSIGKLGFKTMVYFEVITTVAIIVGLVAANVFQPGAGIDMSKLTTSDISQYQQTTQEVSHQAHGLVNTVLSLIPSNIFSAMNDGHMLPIIFCAVIFGIG